MVETSLVVQVMGSTIALRGARITDVDQRLLHVLPGALAVDVGAQETLIHFDSDFLPPTSWTDPASIDLEPGTTEVRFGDVLYGMARFVLSESTARAGVVAADAAGFVDSGGSVVLAAGAGKTNLACCAAKLGFEVLSDDVVLLRRHGDGLVALGRCGGILRSRSGRTVDLGEPRTGSGLVMSTILVQPTIGGVQALERPASVDLSSWWWQALIGRVLNVRAFPAAFRRPYLGYPTEEACTAIARVHDALLPLRSTLLLGDLNPERLHTALEGLT